MASLFWLGVCVYLVVAATTLLDVELRPAALAQPTVAEFCILALLFAASWPMRAVRRGLRRLGRP